jgi:hypothetical protein
MTESIDAVAPARTRWFLEKVVPFGSSVAIHAGVVLVGWVTLEAVRIVNTPPEVRINEPTELISGEVASLTPPGLDRSNMRKFQDDYPDIPIHSTGLSEKPGGSRLGNVLMGGGEAGDPGIIGIGAGERPGKRGTGTGPGYGDGGDDEGGRLAPFGVPTPDGDGREPMVFSPNAARTIAYVCDASGSMLGKFDLLKIELSRSIDALRPIQAFNVIFFQEGAAATFSRDGLVMARPEAKLKAHAFLADVSLSADSDPIPALRAAFQGKPELIYLLTDGEFPNNEKVLAEIGRLNQSKETRVNTIAFGDEGEEDAPYVETLRRIASENGGRFRFVVAASLTQR